MSCVLSKIGLQTQSISKDRGTVALGGELWVSIHLGGHGSYRGAHQRHSGRRADEVLTFFF